jgi:hypothetical protein
MALTRLGRVLVATLGVATLLAAGSGCTRRNGGATAPAAQPPSLADLGRQVGLTFPGGARLLGVSREAGIDDLIRFKVAMNAEDLSQFLAASPLAADAFEPGERGLLGPDQGFWDPSQAAHLRTGQAIVGNHRALNLGIGDAAGRAIVYVVNHGT